MPKDAGAFHKKADYSGEWSDYRVSYARGTEPGGVLVSFSGVHTPAAHGETCDTALDRIVVQLDRRREFTGRIEPWRNLDPLFAGMETGRAAVYGRTVRSDDLDFLMRSEVYILCGTDGSWIVDYRADHALGEQGRSWIKELIAATAPQS